MVGNSLMSPPYRRRAGRKLNALLSEGGVAVAVAVAVAGVVVVVVVVR